MNSIEPKVHKFISADFDRMAPHSINICSLHIPSIFLPEHIIKSTSLLTNNTQQANKIISTTLFVLKFLLRLFGCTVYTESWLRIVAEKVKTKSFLLKDWAMHWLTRKPNQRCILPQFEEIFWLFDSNVIKIAKFAIIAFNTCTT